MGKKQHNAVDFPDLRGHKQAGVAQAGMEVFQTTLRNRIGCAGIGLHTGQQVRFTVFPAEAGSGITFRRTDLRESGGRDSKDQDFKDIEVRARFDSISDTHLGSTLRNASGVSVATVEHLMSAFSGCGIDNARVDLDGPELPVLDGSAAPFVMLLECAGAVRLATPRRYIRILETISVEEDGKRASLSPFEGRAVYFEIDFPALPIGKQSYFFDAVSGNYKTELAPARTFGFLHEVEHLKSLGLARGGTLQNAIVLDGNTILNDGGLRFSDEFVRHKVLDAIGDLYLAGAPILGRFDGVRAGHGLNNKLLLALFSNPHAWEYIEGPMGPPRQDSVVALPKIRRAAGG